MGHHHTARPPASEHRASVAGHKFGQKSLFSRSNSTALDGVYAKYYDFVMALQIASTGWHAGI